MTQLNRMICGREARTWAAAALTAAALTAAGTGCSSGNGAPAKTQRQAQEQADEARPVAASASAPPSVSSSAVQGSGHLVVTYEKGKTAADRQTEAFLKENKVLEGVAEYVDELIALPYDVPLRGRSCGTPNAFWSPETKDISYCYEFLEALKPVYQKQDTTGTTEQRAAEVDSDLVGLTNGVLLHELGHGLVAMYELPITGKEEDAVDQLSTLLLTTGDKTHVNYAISTINAWGGLAEAETKGRLPIDNYADEHSLSVQRYYNWACWLYGSDPDAYQSLVETPDNPDGALPQERAERCPQEFSQIAGSWGTLLDPYMKQ
ncbi:DUF4344 domain-containing metallopeptidase [Streptomyces sp. BE147]|uniref:DUF4344 domain-containing metallopeptidase n=1 Tax=Streptomyces sp. BE147 TaxID=3002524 RepID=UPI002E798FB0|nr:DUF4344 domain-containing metallopeptidase [Streptomyces sp. BE147]MEE1736915.1 DUF4344 domain-containing metallopeptidase [Streptomyces sp. BE147]